MKYKYDNTEINIIDYRRSTKGEVNLPDFINYEKLMEWADSVFERLGYKDSTKRENHN
jgi:hypothetical protein